MDQELAGGWSRTLLADGQWYYCNERGLTMTFKRPIYFHQVDPILPDGHDALAEDGWQLWSLYLSDPQTFVWYNRRLQRVALFDVFREEFETRAAAVRSERRRQRELQDAAERAQAVEAAEKAKARAKKKQRR
ncbi:unnamed protein product [Symbiodinium sp. CCMP2592]|nr:unnamed protein product [Symbiodinium sp. CCMP2592]